MADAAPRRVLITAGAAGIGRAVAEAFLAQGDQVAICDIDAGAVAEAQAAHPAMIATVADVGDENAVDGLFDLVERELGGLDVVFANAGTGGPAAPIEHVALDDWRDTLRVNLDGAFLTARRAAPLLKASKGRLIFTSSTAGLFGYPFRSPYAAAKWAIVGLTKTCAMELGPHGVAVNAICPGVVEGDRMDRVIANEARVKGVSEAEIRESYVASASLRTMISAEDIADMALFLASPAAAKISGQAIPVDGHTERLTL